MERKSIRVTNLFLDLDNFRFEHQNSQLDAINTMVDAYIDELYKLAVDILKIGLNPMDIPYVLPHPTEEKKYIVLEGNRRITTLKLLLNPNLIDPKHITLRRKFIKLKEKHSKDLIHVVECGVCESRDEGYRWIERKHANGVGGIGTKQWNPLQKQRFDKATKGKESLALQVINMLTSSSLVEDDFKKKLEKLNTSNLERLLSDPHVRGQLGLVKQQGRLVSDIKPEVLTEAMVGIVSDMLTPSFKVAVIYHKTDREKYINDMFRDTGSPNVMTNKVARWNLNEESTKIQEEEVDQRTKPKKALAPKPRKVLVPKGLHLPITDDRIAKIFKEMGGLLVHAYVNTVAILLRIFMEMSVDVYLETFNLLPEDKLTASQSGKTLYDKIRKVITHMNTRYKKDQLLQRILRIAAYADRIELHNEDAVDFIQNTAKGEIDNMLFYLDPPYYKKGQGLYMNYYNDEDHKKIKDVVSTLDKVKWVVSYDNSDFIKSLYQKYRHHEFQLNYSANNNGTGTEIIFFSDNCRLTSESLHELDFSVKKMDKITI